MKNHPLTDRVAVCSWSLQPANPQDLIEKLNFAGDCVIEREAGNQRVADVRTARDMVARM